jgi:phosphoribosylamine--glycine ligase
MNILLIGSGGREHALALALSKSDNCSRLFAAPGNPGIFKLAHNAVININVHSEVLAYCRDNDIGLVVIGPEQPLAEGLSDILRDAGVNVFGPSQKAAMLESSKSFAKDFMVRNGIPTADYKVFNTSEFDSAMDYLDEAKYPLVIKADGLAAGKGVIICNSVEESRDAAKQIFEGLFGDSGKSIVIEEFLSGEEASVLAITDGKEFITLASSQDHKRAYDGDAGPNTGGMGAYAPAPIITIELEEKIKQTILAPTIKSMAEEGSDFVGCLYAGLMIKDDEPFVIEFNARFGDPETEAVLSIFEGDFASLLYSAAIGNLDKNFMTSPGTQHACCIIAAAGGYPGTYGKGFPINGIDEAEISGALVYQAGTTESNSRIVSSGGRVLAVTGLGDSLKSAIDNAYTAIDKISFETMFFRKDIGAKGLRREA